MKLSTRFAAVFYMMAGEELDITINPVTTMAKALGDARLARQDKEQSYREAHERALELIGEHFGQLSEPVVSVHPADVTDAAGAASVDAVRYGVVLASLARLAQDVANESGLPASELNTASLLQALVDDLSSSDALFNGVGVNGPVLLGACPMSSDADCPSCSTICNVGARTVRNDLANAIGGFIDSQLNATGLGADDLATMKARIAKNTEPELFGDEADVELDPPAVTIDSDHFVVDAGVWWSRDAALILSGSVVSASSGAIRVLLDVNDQAGLPAEIVGDRWQLAVPQELLREAPASNAIRVTAVDSLDNRASLSRAINIDRVPISLEFSPTAVRDEAGDVIDFTTPRPTHNHLGSTLNIGGPGCPKVNKHVTLMDGNDNPLVLNFTAREDVLQESQ